MDALINKTGHHLLLPFYHAVSDKNPIHIKHLYEPRSIEKFKADLDFLQEHYESIPLQQLMQGVPKDKKCFHITFDDGLSEFYDVVAPILKEKGIHATVFLNSNFIDNKELFYRFKASILYNKLKDKSLLSITYKDKAQLDNVANQHNIDFTEYLANKKPYLSSDQIKELINDGFTFGAHSLDHPLYNGLTKEQQLIQTRESVETIMSRFNLDYKVFSFPFTDDGVSKAFFEEVSSSVDFTFGCAGLKEDSAKSHLQRIPMELEKAGKDIIKGEYLYYIMKEKAGKHKIVRQ